MGPRLMLPGQAQKSGPQGAERNPHSWGTHEIGAASACPGALAGGLPLGGLFGGGGGG